MYKKILALVTKYWDVLSYLFFGGLTTVVSFAIYFFLQSGMHLSGTISNIISWVGAVAFAFLTNKPWVFKSHDWSMKTTLPELSKFVSCRVASGVMETGIIMVTVDILGWNSMVWKLIASVLVVIANYYGSKFLVFRRK